LELQRNFGRQRGKVTASYTIAVEEGKKMKIKTYYLILAVTAGFFCAAASNPVEPPQSGGKPLLINPPHPAFAGIDELHVTVLRFGPTREKDRTFTKQIEADTEERLRNAGIELAAPTADNILTIPELRIYINTLSLEDSQQCVFHVRVALARAVCLKDEQTPVFKAAIWQTAPEMQAVSEQDTPEKVADLVAEQVDGFIDIFKTTNTSDAKPSEAGIGRNASSSNPLEQADKNENSTAVEYRFVSSSNSNVFHKPGCRWAQNISKENLVIYKSREEAIKAGKRPCKTCNP
jgi:hypothetical protein